MTKTELYREFSERLESKRMHSMDGIGKNSRKAELENAIACLECSDEILREYFIIVKHKYPAVHKAIEKVGYMEHQHNRLWVYDTARRAVGIN